MTTASQPLEALAKGNEIRMARAAIRRSIASGDLSLLDFLHDYPPALANCTVHRMLTAVPRFGPARADRFLDQAEVDPRATFASLTQRQRLLLEFVLRGKA